MGKSERIMHKVNGETVATFNLANGTATVAVYSSDELGLVFSRATGVFGYSAPGGTGYESPEFRATVLKSGTRWATHVTMRYMRGGVWKEFRWESGTYSGTRGTAVYRAFMAFGAAVTSGEIADAVECEARESLALARTLMGSDETGPATQENPPYVTSMLRMTGPRKPEPTEAERAELIAAETARRAARKAARDAGEVKPLARKARKSAPVAEPVTDVRESAPDAPKPAKRTRRTRKAAPAGAEVCASTGLTFAAMRDAVAAHYAAGYPVPVEVSRLPDPTVTRSAMTGGSARGSDEYRGCEGKGAHVVPNLERTHGKCPECRAYIPLLDTKDDDDFRIGSHFEYGLTAPAVPDAHRLKSRSIENVEHGTIPGDAAAADKRRAAEAQCAKSGKMSRRKSGGTHPCPTCKRPVELIRVATAKDDKWKIPKHVRPDDSFRRAGADGKAERKVTPRGKGADVGRTAVKGAGPVFTLSRGHGTVDGAANVGGVNLAPVQPKRGRLAVAGTMSLPATVRPGVDPGVEGELCPVCNDYKWRAHRGQSRKWRRKHSQRVAAWHREQDVARKVKRETEELLGRAVITTELANAEREGRDASAPALPMPGAMRRAARKRASIGSSAAGTLATTGAVVHAPTLDDAAE